MYGQARPTKNSLSSLKAVDRNPNALQKTGKNIVNAALSLSLLCPIFLPVPSTAAGFDLGNDKPQSNDLGAVAKDLTSQFNAFKDGAGIKAFKVPAGIENLKEIENLKAATKGLAEKGSSMAQDIKVPDVKMPDTLTLTKDLKTPEMKMPDVKPQGTATASSSSKPTDKPSVASSAKEKQQITKIVANDRVKVDQAFESDSEDSKMLAKGLSGKVVEIDEEGDALIDFKKPVGQQYVSKNSFSKLVKE